MVIPKPIPETGFAVPLRAAFLVFKRWPLFGVASNNLNPRLTLFAEHLEYSVLRVKRRSYRDIATVDARQWLSGNNLIFHWQGGLFSVSANVGQAAALVAVLEFFVSKGFALSETAKQILASAPSILNSTQA